MCGKFWDVDEGEEKRRMWIDTKKRPGKIKQREKERRERVKMREREGKGEMEGRRR